jgi:hypothetical protein
MLKRVFRSLVLLLFFLPLPVYSQTAEAGGTAVPDASAENTAAPSDVRVQRTVSQSVETVPVSVMTFVGDDLAISAQLHDAVIAEVNTIGNYNIHQVSAAEFPEQTSLPPDEPPDPWYLGVDSRYVLTGEFYIDMDEEMHHFQLWLWRSQEGSLVYTDELVAEDLDEAMSYMPALVNWVFSRIPQERRVTVLERQQGVDVNVKVDTSGNSGNNTGNSENSDGSNTEKAGSRSETLSDPLNRWLYLGLRFGGSFRFYGLPKVVADYSSNYTQGFTYEAGVQVGFRFLSFLSVQGEVIFTQDNAPFRGPKFNIVNDTEIRYIYFTDNYVSSSLMIPILVKFHIKKDPFVIAPFGGVYWAIPLGLLEFQTTETGGANQKYEYHLSSGLGMALGVNAGLKLGPGILFLDLRYAFDFGKTLIAMESGREYTRSMISFSLGYELAFINKKRRVNINQ